MVEEFLKNGGYVIEKSEDNSNPFTKINIEEQKRVIDDEDYFNGEKDVEDEEEDVLFLEDVDDSKDSEDEDEEDDEH